MPHKGKLRSNRTLFIGAVFTIIATLVAGGLILRKQSPAPQATSPGSPPAASEKPLAPGDAGGKVTLAVKEEPLVDYNAISEDRDLSSMMAKRKAKYHVEKGVDLIVRSDETLKVGVSTVRMKEVLDTIRLERGELLETGIDGTPSESRAVAAEYGIHVVKPGENIWNIHFTLLREYLGNKGVAIGSRSDEPKNGGRSSGVGKLLKFSEKMVSIYNIADRKLASDIHIIRPDSKLVVYNMKELFKLIEEIEATDIDRIWFDGETIWIPAS